MIVLSLLLRAMHALTQALPFCNPILISVPPTPSPVLNEQVLGVGLGLGLGRGLGRGRGLGLGRPGKEKIMHLDT